MPQLLPAAGGILGWGSSWLSGSAVLAAVGKVALVVAASAAASRYQAKQLDQDGKFQGREVLIRSAKDPQTIVFGEAWVGGVVVYANQRHTPGSKDNFEMYLGVVHAAHECTAITDLYYDNDLLRDGTEIDWASGHVIAGKYGVTKAGVYAANVEKKLGTSSQTVSTLLSSAFPTDFTAAHRLRGNACTFHKFTLFSQTTTSPDDIFYSGVPQNVRAKVKGCKIYDPRKDSTNGGSGSHRFATPSTWEWSSNPILCWTHYLTQYKGVDFARIDWDWLRPQADICDQLVPIPGGTEKRYTCNGAISLGMTHRQIREDILSSCMGTCPKVNGKWRPTAGAYGSAGSTISEADYVGEISVTTARRREDRFNSVKATYFDPNSFAQEIDSLPISNSDYALRDGEFIEKVIALPMTNSEYMAQRICYKHLQQSRGQITVVVPLRFTGLPIYPGLRAQMTYSDLGWSRKIFRCTNWTFGGETPVSAVLVEDSAAAWLDPVAGAYSTRNAQGVVTRGAVELTTPTTGAGAGEITARNAGFEFGDVFWSQKEAGWSIVRDTSNAHSGDWHAKREALPGDDGNAAMRNRQLYPCSAGDYFTVGGFVKSSSGAVFSRAGWRISWRNASGNEISSNNAVITAASTTWVGTKASVRAPSGAHFAVLEGVVTGHTSGTVYIDDGFNIAQTGAQLGTNVIDGSGNTVDDDDLLNSNLIVPAAALQVFAWTSSDGSTYVPSATTKDLTATFKRTTGVVVASRTIRGTRSGNNVTLSSIATAGGATGYTASGSGTPAATATITYTDTKGKVATATLVFTVISTFTGGGGPSK